MAQLKYTTAAGDTYDMISLDMYNDEFLAHIIAEANPEYADVVVFDAGISLTIPIIEEKAAATTLPPWRR